MGVHAEGEHEKTRYLYKESIHKKPIYREHVQILWRAGMPQIELDEVLRGWQDQRSQVWKPMSEEDLPADKLDYLISVISATVPAFSRRFLEQHYEPMNHASNSATRDHTFEE